MNIILSEKEKALSMQESYFNNLLEIGRMFQSSGQYQKACEIYKKGIEKAEIAKTDFMETMLDLLGVSND